MTTSCQNDELLDERGRKVNHIKKLGKVLFLGEVALMFSGLFLVMNALWVFVLSHFIATMLGIFVLRTAYRAGQVIPPSRPFQRPTRSCSICFGAFYAILFSRAVANRLGCGLLDSLPACNNVFVRAVTNVGVVQNGSVSVRVGIPLSDQEFNDEMHCL